MKNKQTKTLALFFSSLIETPNLITNLKNFNDSKIANKTVFLKNIGPGRSVDSICL